MKHSMMDTARVLYSMGIRAQDVQNEIDFRREHEYGVAEIKNTPVLDSENTTALCKYSTQYLKQVLIALQKIEYELSTQIEEREDV